jgi:hypothetical protein
MTTDTSKVAQFLTSQTRPKPGHKIRYSILHAAFNRWAGEDFTRHRFSEALDKLGHPRTLGRGNYTYVSHIELIERPAMPGFFCAMPNIIDHGISHHGAFFVVSLNGRKFPGRFDTLAEARQAKSIGMAANFWN